MRKILDIFGIPTYCFMFDFFDDSNNYIGSLTYTFTASSLKRAMRKMKKEISRANLIGLSYTLDIERV